MQIENAIIKSTFLSVDRNILTAYLNIEWESMGCDFGGYRMDISSDAEIKGHAFGSAFIRSILDTLEIESWEALPNTFLRIEHSGPGVGISRIGHIIKDKWFDPQVLAAKYKDQ